MENTDKKGCLEDQFQEMLDKARELYPDIDDTITTLNNMTSQTNNLQDYLNLTHQMPAETSNNQIIFA
jgi:hypothetical protein